MMLLALTSFIACSLVARGFQLQSRSIQTDAVCSADFSWADNSVGDSPCRLAAVVNAPCNQGNWFIPALNSTFVYTPPTIASPTTTGSVATVCTCSWASYNLISACTDCQGFSNVTTSWAAYSLQCTGFLTPDTYYPPNMTLPPDTRIPFYATTNPTTWTGQQFDVATAESISKQNHPNVGNSPAETTTKPTPIGAIVGGVVGGIVVLLAAIILGICLIRRNSRHNNVADPSPLLMANNTHLRSQSDFSNNMSMPNISTPGGYTSLSSSPMRPSSPTIRTHASTSIRSFPFFSSAGSTVSPSVRQQSPPPVSMQRDETAVEPFRLAPTNNFNPDRKQANGAYPVYDPPTAPPTVRTEAVRSTTPTQGGRTRYNPPAYAEQTKGSPEAGSPSSRRSPPTVGQVHGKKGSADTQHSFTSGGSTPRVGGSNPARGNNVVFHLTPPGTVKNLQMESHGASASTSLNAITGHGRQVSGDTNSDTGRKRRPDTDENFSVRDIA